LAGLLWGRGEGKPRMDFSLIQFFFSWFSFHLTTSISWADLARWRYDSDLWIELDFLSESEGDEWGRKLTILLVCKVAPRAEPKPAVSRPGSFNSFYLNYVFSYVFRLCYLVAFGLDSPLPRRDQLLRLGKRLPKSVSVYMCLRLCYPFPGKEIIRWVKKTRIKNQKERRERTGSWRLHNR